MVPFLYKKIDNHTTVQKLKKNKNKQKPTRVQWWCSAKTWGGHVCRTNNLYFILYLYTFHYQCILTYSESFLSSFAQTFLFSFSPFLLPSLVYYKKMKKKNKVKVIKTRCIILLFKVKDSSDNKRTFKLKVKVYPQCILKSFTFSKVKSNITQSLKLGYLKKTKQTTPHIHVTQ